MGVMEAFLGGEWSQGKSLEGAGVNGPVSVLLEGAGIRSSLRTMEFKQSAAHVDGHTALLGVWFVAFFIRWSGIFNEGTVVEVWMPIGIVPWERSCRMTCRRVGN